MDLKNPQMAHARLGVPGVGEVVGDHRGHFLGLPDAFAQRLLGTPGWEAITGTPTTAQADLAALDAARVAREVADASHAARLADEARARAAAEAQAAAQAAQAQTVVADEARAQREAQQAREAQDRAEREQRAVAAAKAAVAPTEPATPTSTDSPGEEGPDLERMTKQELLDTARDYGVPVKASWRVEQLKQVLDKELYEDDGGEGEPPAQEG